MMEEQIVIPLINKKLEKINSNIFNDKGSRYEVVESDEHEVYTSANVGFGKVTYFNNSYFKVLKSFYSNETSKRKGVMFNNGSKYGTWYHYDEQGNLIKEENTDLGYDFGWLDVIKYCHKNNIVLEKGYPKRGGIKTEIYKNEEEGKKVWTISYYNAKKDEYLEVTLDGTTGKELKRRELEFVGN